MAEEDNRTALPTDGNHQVIMGGVSTDDGVTPVPLEVDPLTGRLIVDSGSASASAAKPTDAYSISAISETATHKYFFFEDKNGAWYIMRRNLSTNTYDYAAGTGGYESVYDTPTTEPTGSVTYESYATTFG
jgi:hypothetical protein